MRKNITSVILFALLLCAVGGMLSRCGRDGGTHLESVPAAETVKKDFPALQEELRPAVVQIFCGDHRGSGVVWEITDRDVTVVSSAHLLKNGDTCEVLCHAGVYYEAKVERILEDCDVGFAVFAADTLKEDGAELRAVIPSPRTAGELVQGEELIVYGSMDSVAGDFVEGYLIEAESEMQIDGYDNARPLLLGGIVRKKGQGDAEETGAESAGPDTANAGETVSGSDRGPVDAGMSGSGVFDGNGELLGILAGGDGESGFAAVPVWRIRADLPGMAFAP